MLLNYETPVVVYSTRPRRIISHHNLICFYSPEILILLSINPVCAKMQLSNRLIDFVAEYLLEKFTLKTISSL